MHVTFNKPSIGWKGGDYNYSAKITPAKKLFL